MFADVGLVNANILGSESAKLKSEVRNAKITFHYLTVTFIIQRPLKECFKLPKCATLLHCY